MPGPHPRHLAVACLLVAGALTSVTVATPVAADTELDRARTQLSEEVRTTAELRI